VQWLNAILCQPAITSDNILFSLKIDEFMAFWRQDATIEEQA